MSDRRPPLNAIPQDTCPLCRWRALSVLPGASGDEVICTCGYCGSQFIYDPAARKSRYVYVAPDYAAVADRLIGRPLTRRETFEAIDAAGLGVRGRQALPAGFFWLILVAMIGVIAITCACSSALALGPSMAQTRRQIAALNAGALTDSPAAGTRFRRDRPRRRRNCADRGGSSAS